MKTLIASFSAIAIVLTILFISPVAGQGDIETRVAELETRVAELETIAASLPPSELPGVQSPESYSIQGMVVIGQSKMIPTLGGGCIPSVDVTDAREGTDVTLRDESSKIIGSSVLTSGMVDDDLAACVFRFEFREVPKAEFYTLTIGQYDDLTYSFDEMVSSGWKPVVKLA